MAQVHPTAVVHPGARLHETVEVGPYAVIGEKVTIGEGTRVGPHVVIDGRTTIGARNRIFPFASVGGAPQDLKYAGEDTQLIIGDGNTLRESTTLNIGTAGGGGVTRVGNNNLFMAYSHVAHDCVVGNGCVVANSVALAGHVVLEDSVILGGLSAVHQFTRLGKHSFIAGGSMVVMDVAPYCTAQGDRAELAGLNVVGLQRHGFTRGADRPHQGGLQDPLPLEAAAGGGGGPAQGGDGRPVGDRLPGGLRQSEQARADALT